MKKVFKILGIVVAVIAVVIIGGLVYFNASYPKVDPPKDIKIEATAERLSRGEYLANHVAVCIDCHSEREWTKFAGPIKPGTKGSGGEVFDENMGFPGMVVTKNLTPANLSSWTDGEILRAVTCGVTKDNKALFPMMPYMNYSNFMEEDAYSVVAYIRSLQPQEKEIPETDLNFPLNLLVKTMPLKSYTPAKEIDKSNPAEYGKYLVTIASCSECHTQSNKGEPLPGMYLAGGQTFNFPAGVVSSANITPDAVTGIGNWTKEDFLNRFRFYNSEEAQNVPVNLEKDFNTPMPWLMYSGMTDEDLGAIYEYLRTIKPVNNSVNRFVPHQAN
ncbi:MAG: cytochrome C [Ignavibacteria bacterium GWA2_35_9]|nr:MAG: cytochrome C [Ignavibacteria bacterium GWA2_35_9]OGU50544.1 MAG: cytochrome C [Ignavibacteria bacterium GWC2_36_12]OGU99715.1 MAG: cytochrome C [Ignavibacteria bacterium RIFOXYB2_FULL_36_7]